MEIIFYSVFNVYTCIYIYTIIYTCIIVYSSIYVCVYYKYICISQHPPSRMPLRLRAFELR